MRYEICFAHRSFSEGERYALLTVALALAFAKLQRSKEGERYALLTVALAFAKLQRSKEGER
jgi:hypothetical protein